LDRSLEVSTAHETPGKENSLERKKKETQPTHKARRSFDRTSVDSAGRRKVKGKEEDL